jgi:hypothetical protein
LTSFLQAVADDGPLLAVIVLIFITGWKRVWLFARELDRLERQLTDERVDFMGQLGEMRREKEQWRSIALWQAGHPSMQDKPPPLAPPEGD